MSAGHQSLRFDAGWLFVIAGLVICAAGMILPAQRALARIDQQLAILKRQELITNDRLAAHERFLADLEAGDATLLRRLAASQLNLMREGEKPFLLSSTAHEPITNWIDSTVRIPPEPTQRPIRSALSKLSSGSHRLWFLAGGVLCVFIGLLLDASWPGAKHPPPHEGAAAVMEAKPESTATVEESGVELIIDGHEAAVPDLTDRMIAPIEIDEAAVIAAEQNLAAESEPFEEPQVPAQSQVPEAAAELEMGPPIAEVVVMSDAKDQLIAAENAQSAEAFGVQAEPSQSDESAGETVQSNEEEPR